MERCGLRVQPESHIHSLGSARECEGMNPHTPKWTPILGLPLWELESLWNLEFSKSNLKGQNSLDWEFIYTIGNILRCRFLNWACMTHLRTYKTSYGWKNGQESKCQFDSRPLKVKNRPELHACRCSVTYSWKDFNEGYNFSLHLISIEGLQKKLWASKVAGVSISRILGLLTWGLEKNDI
jgi:hypothetical protein